MSADISSQLCSNAPSRRLTPRSSGAPTAGHQARSGGMRCIFASPGLASCRRHPLSSNVRPRMLTSAASAPCFETQQRGTSAFVAYGKHCTASSDSAGSKQPLFSAHHLSWHSARTSFAKLRGSCRLGAFFSSQGPSLSASSYVSTCCAAATQLRTVQGLTPRSSGAPTAAHQARSVVLDHSPQPGPGVLPLSPA